MSEQQEQWFFVLHYLHYLYRRVLENRSFIFFEHWVTSACCNNILWTWYSKKMFQLAISICEKIFKIQTVKNIKQKGEVLTNFSFCNFNYKFWVILSGRWNKVLCNLCCRSMRPRDTSSKNVILSKEPPAAQHNCSSLNRFQGHKRLRHIPCVYGSIP